MVWGLALDEPDPFGLGILVVTLKLLVMAAQVHVKNGLAMTIAAGCSAVTRPCFTAYMQQTVEQ